MALFPKYPVIFEKMILWTSGFDMDLLGYAHVQLTDLLSTNCYCKYLMHIIALYTHHWKAS